MQPRKLTSRFALVLALSSPLLVSIAGVQICTSSDALTAALFHTKDLERLSDLRADLVVVPSASQSMLLARHGFHSTAELDARFNETQSEVREFAEGVKRSTFMMLATVLAALLSTCATSLALTRRN
ncbi:MULTISPECIES: hypothetical protein [unclassified Caballeronia]|uniref:hypothetical protein n=1 Tax=unclassified Caballeronia TaxID=2646786 RepID=UPI002860E214|nr:MULTISPECIES: hypothetical protein [unclassified Caballeronia]MDR5777111.1 hypothetical protein [Caballeronia sp. LZ002]MDR5798734.1 hypothetical protein [Caballeronia sp. LZ001]MDR5852556.1 hypothetical protein [Caballeronia sp. LZ003]